MKDKTRSYQKKARAESEKETGEAILDAALKAFSNELFDRVTLQQIASDSGVTVQTVIRRFGSKEELFEHLANREGKRIIADREVPEDEGISAALAALVKHYERDGDMMINFICQEQHFEPIRKIVERGREVHRKWVKTHCRNLLSGINGKEKERIFHATITATDLYTWKLLRRDYGLESNEVLEIMQKILNGLNGGK